MNNQDLWSTNKSRIDAPRSRFNRPFTHKTTFNASQIIPLGWDEVYPGDTLKRDFSFIVRMLTPLRPVMDNAYLDIHCFFVPMRLVWEHAEQFFGQNDNTFWTESDTYTIPQANDTASNTGIWKVEVGSIGDYLGLPVETEGDTKAGSLALFGFSVTELPLRAYYMVFNDWYRDENTTAPKLFIKGDESNGRNVISYHDSPAKAARFHSYFGSALPSPQKGNPAAIADSWLPVLPHGTAQENLTLLRNNNVAAQYVSRVSSGAAFSQAYGPSNVYLATDTPTMRALEFAPGAGTDNYDITPGNLYAYAANAFSIESIRKAAVIQHVYEALARGGSRYIEFVKAIFNVSASDARLDRPEYLGGMRFPLTMQEVLSNTDNTASEGLPLGATGAMSKTGDANQHLFNKSFTEHGILLTCIVVRHQDTFFQGIEKKWSKKEFFDFHMPQMSYLGEQPIYKKELIWPKPSTIVPSSQNISSKDTEIFGYQEYGAELRYAVDRLSGYMRPNVDEALSDWTYAEILPDTVALNSGFMEADSTGIDRTIAIPSSSRPAIQFFGDFKFNDVWTRELPTRSIPGLRYL